MYMDKFWEDIMNCLLGVDLYHGKLPDEESWCKEYEYEVNNMVEDIKHFHDDNVDVGLEVSNEEMARFLVYTEAEHLEMHNLSTNVRKMNRNCLL